MVKWTGREKRRRRGSRKRYMGRGTDEKVQTACYMFLIETHRARKTENLVKSTTREKRGRCSRGEIMG